MACYDQGRRLHTSSFLVFALPREDALWRVGLAVSKKIGSAVRRNRVKRVLREFFRLNQHAMPPGMDVVVVAKRGLNPQSLTLAQAVRELTPLVRRGFTARKNPGPKAPKGA